MYCGLQRGYFTDCWSGRTTASRGLLVPVLSSIFWRRSSNESTRHPASTRCSASLVTSYCYEGIIVARLLRCTIVVDSLLLKRTEHSSMTQSVTRLLCVSFQHVGHQPARWHAAGCQHAGGRCVGFPHYPEKTHIARLNELAHVVLRTFYRPRLWKVKLGLFLLTL